MSRATRGTEGTAGFKKTTEQKYGKYVKKQTIHSNSCFPSHTADCISVCSFDSQTNFKAIYYCIILQYIYILLYITV